MDHIRILNQIRDRKTIEKAFQYAIFDRINNDFYFDYFELGYVFSHKDTIVQEILDELKVPEKYTARPAYAYYPPKTDLCYRRMIYIPFKDLVVRYAFVIILAEYLDQELSPHCFAHRRATGERAKEAFLKEFATDTWPAFCQWQQERIEKYSTLLRTDISAFYDSVSHDYLIQVIANQLSVKEDTAIMQLFRSLLCIPVISYSQISKIPQETQENRQGLAIGNGTEGFLANLYLKNVDEVMAKLPDIEFGRYCDDMRIFSHNRETALHAVLALQELLLTKGLNLNSSKTQIAENKQELDELRSKLYQPSPSEAQNDEHDEEESNIQPPQDDNANILKEKIDKPFDVFERRFTLGEPLKEHGDAKDFCKFLQTKDLPPLSDRQPEHITTLIQILKRWQGNGKSATWLIMQSAFFDKVPQKTREIAKKAIFESLQTKEIDTYSKYRLLHHLVKRRGKNPKFRYVDRFSQEEKKQLWDIMPNLLVQPAFELNITGLYVLKVLGASYTQLNEYVQKYIPKPVGEPIKNALSYIAEPIEVSQDLQVNTEEETDNRVEPY